MANYIYELKDKVRDYECDLQGIVNNANYQHYLEHARHEFLLAHNISFAELHEKGTDAVVARLTMQFKVPLKSGDEYVTRIRIKKDGIKYKFLQDIYRLPDEKLSIRAEVDSVCLVNGRLSDCEELNKKFAPFFEEN
ncbi:MAG: acyl-CoA thioesterase [Bacteroidaceae bacterium]|nr:acyl-CoA thioesterase [Bacteroidaceae bacterium]